jgi:hypothetical protein
MRVLIDGDPIVYRAGFSAQNNWKIINWVTVVDEDDPEGDIEHEAFFAYEYEVQDFLEAEGIHEDEYTKTIWVDPLAESHAMQITKTALSTVVSAVKGFLNEDENLRGHDIEVEVYLSGSTNFRNKVATIPTFKKDGTEVAGYKANRTNNERPYWYAAIRKYMVEYWGATVFEGIEADDALAIAQWAEDEYDPQTIICTIDKDLRNVPGWHYNVLKKTDEHISYNLAQLNFYRQILTGDSTDNIPGLYRVGKGAAEKLLHENMSQQTMYDVCLEQYQINLAKYPERHGRYGEGHEMGAPLVEAAKLSLLENARLLWMLQHEDQAWTPPGEPDGSLEALGFVDEPEEWT